MEFTDYKILWSIAVIIFVFFTRLFIARSLKKIQVKFSFQKARILVTNKIITILLYISQRNHPEVSHNWSLYIPSS